MRWLWIAVIGLALGRHESKLVNVGLESDVPARPPVLRRVPLSPPLSNSSLLAPAWLRSSRIEVRLPSRPGAVQNRLMCVVARFVRPDEVETARWDEGLLPPDDVQCSWVLPAVASILVNLPELHERIESWSRVQDTPETLIRMDALAIHPHSKLHRVWRDGSLSKSLALLQSMWAPPVTLAVFESLSSVESAEALEGRLRGLAWREFADQEPPVVLLPRSMAAMLDAYCNQPWCDLVARRGQLSQVELSLPARLDQALLMYAARAWASAPPHEVVSELCRAPSGLVAVGVGLAGVDCARTTPRGCSSFTSDRSCAWMCDPAEIDPTELFLSGMGRLQCVLRHLPPSFPEIAWGGLELQEAMLTGTAQWEGGGCAHAVCSAVGHQGVTLGGVRTGVKASTAQEMQPDRVALRADGRDSCATAVPATTMQWARDAAPGSAVGWPWGRGEADPAMPAPPCFTPTWQDSMLSLRANVLLGYGASHAEGLVQHIDGLSMPLAGVGEARSCAVAHAWLSPRSGVHICVSGQGQDQVISSMGQHVYSRRLGRSGGSWCMLSDPFGGDLWPATPGVGAEERSGCSSRAVEQSQTTVLVVHRPVVHVFGHAIVDVLVPVVWMAMDHDVDLTSSDTVVLFSDDHPPGPHDRLLSVLLGPRTRLAYNASDTPCTGPRPCRIVTGFTRRGFLRATERHIQRLSYPRRALVWNLLHALVHRAIVQWAKAGGALENAAHCPRAGTLTEIAHCLFDRGADPRILVVDRGDWRRLVPSNALRGLPTVDLGKIPSLEEQFAVLYSADVIVAVDGSALEAAQMASRPGACIVAVAPRGWWYAHATEHMMMASTRSYFVIPGDTTPAGVSIPPGALEWALAQCRRSSLGN
jgi:hypothetical protein